MKRLFMPKVLALVITAAAFGCGRQGEEPVAVGHVVTNAADLVCSYAPSQSAVVSHISALAGGGAAASGAIATATGLTVVTHSSGAYILTGSGGYIAGTLGTAVAGPVILLVGVAIGGSAATVELLCAPKNHREFAAKVEATAREFVQRSRDVGSGTATSALPVIAKLKATSLKAGTEAVEYARRKSVEISEAVKTAIN